MPYYNIHIKGSGGTSELRDLFENTFESSLKDKAGGGHAVTYSWGGGGDMPGGMQKVLDIISSAAPASGAGHSGKDQSDIPPSKPDQNGSGDTPAQQNPAQQNPVQQNPVQQNLVQQDPAQQSDGGCNSKTLDVVA